MIKLNKKSLSPQAQYNLSMEINKLSDAEILALNYELHNRMCKRLGYMYDNSAPDMEDEEIEENEEFYYKTQSEEYEKEKERIHEEAKEYLCNNFGWGFDGTENLYEELNIRQP